MSTAWGKIGNWAEEAEREEAEEAAAAASPAYPSLKESAAAGGSNNNKKGNNKKKTKMSLHEFTMTSGGAAVRGGGGLTPVEMMHLPTGPKERSGEEMQYGGGRMGGGRFGGGPGMRDGEGSWGGGNRRSYDNDYNNNNNNRRERERGPSEYDVLQSSRADEVDNWATTKKTPSFDSTRPIINNNNNNNQRYDSSFTSSSRADDTDNWALNKKQQQQPIQQPPPPPVRSSATSFGGFRDSAAAPEADRWSRGVNLEPPTERRRLVLDPPKGESVSVPGGGSNNSKPSPFGNARPREEILADKGLDWKKADLELDAKRVTSRPTSSHSNSRPGSAHSGSSLADVSAALQGLEKPRQKVNPFGDAKPREVLLQEKGVDYRKIDLELERKRLGRPDTEDEKNLKEEIYNIKLNFEKGSIENQTSLHNTIVEKERELEQLSRDLDDKLRLSKKTIERPSSGSGRVGPGFQERPGSGAGRVGPGFQERPGSGAGRVGPGFFQERPGSGAGRVGPGFQERPGSGSGTAGFGFQERPGSGSGTVGFGFQHRPPFQSGSFDESRSVDFSERPQFRGDYGMRRGDDRRDFGVVRDNRGFLGNRDTGRSNSRDRW